MFRVVLLSLVCACSAFTATRTLAVTRRATLAPLRMANNEGAKKREGGRVRRSKVSK